MSAIGAIFGWILVSIGGLWALVGVFGTLHALLGEPSATSQSLRVFIAVILYLLPGLALGAIGAVLLVLVSSRPRLQRGGATHD